jgi:hypothetical protein
MHEFMKDKLCNRLSLHLDAIVCIFDKSFILKKFPLSRSYYSLEELKSPDWCYLLASSVLFTTKN